LEYITGSGRTAFNNIGFAGTVARLFPPTTRRSSATTVDSAFTVSQKLVTPRYVSYNLNLESQVAKSCGADWICGSQDVTSFTSSTQPGEQRSGSTDTCANGTTIGYMHLLFEFRLHHQIETSAISNYNSLQASLKVQNLHGLTSTLNYTWAHSIDTATMAWISFQRRAARQQFQSACRARQFEL